MIRTPSGYSYLALIVLAFIVGMVTALVGSSAMIARRQTVLLGETARQEACRNAILRVSPYLEAARFPRFPTPRYPWTLPCDRADDCPDQAQAVAESDLAFRAVPTANGFVMFIWRGQEIICKGDLYVPAFW